MSLQRPPYFASLRCPRLLSPVVLLRPRPTPAPTPTGMEAPPRQGRLRLVHRPALSRSSVNACGRQELAGLDHPCLWLPCRALGGFTPGTGPPHPPEQPGMDPGQQRRALVLITEAEAGEAGWRGQASWAVGATKAPAREESVIAHLGVHTRSSSPGGAGAGLGQVPTHPLDEEDRSPQGFQTARSFLTPPPDGSTDSCCPASHLGQGGQEQAPRLRGPHPARFSAHPLPRAPWRAPSMNPQGPSFQGLP